MVMSSWCHVDGLLMLFDCYFDASLCFWLLNYFHCVVVVTLLSVSPRCHVDLMLIWFCCVFVCYRLCDVDVILMLVRGFDDLVLNLCYDVSSLLLGYFDVILALVWICFGVIFRVMCYVHCIFDVVVRSSCG